jgi:hypothetical protein
MTSVGSILCLESGTRTAETDFRQKPEEGETRHDLEMIAERLRRDAA